MNIQNYLFKNIDVSLDYEMGMWEYEYKYGLPAWAYHNYELVKSTVEKYKLQKLKNKEEEYWNIVKDIERLDSV